MMVPSWSQQVACWAIHCWNRQANWDDYSLWKTKKQTFQSTNQLYLPKFMVYTSSNNNGLAVHGTQFCELFLVRNFCFIQGSCDPYPLITNHQGDVSEHVEI